MKLSDDQLRKIHRTAHASARRLFAFLKSTMSKHVRREELTELWKRVSRVVDECRKQGACSKFEKRAKRA